MVEIKNKELLFRSIHVYATKEALGIDVYGLMTIAGIAMISYIHTAKYVVTSSQYVHVVGYVNFHATKCTLYVYCHVWLDDCPTKVKCETTKGTLSYHKGW